MKAIKYIYNCRNAGYKSGSPISIRDKVWHILCDIDCRRILNLIPANHIVPSGLSL